ncbi:MAG: DNA polymerase III subunit alpha, partial [Cyanobacteriota bacterium]|nr:DNA polymerase III subunit alpha [Cyanobacteriota bacterium]
MSFVGLHIHSDYSLLDGASQLPQLIDKAVELGMPAIALTDHGVMYGAIQLIKLCRNKGIKPIIGNEMYVINGDIEKQQKGKKFHQVVLAKNTQGYKNLVKLTTLSHLHGFQGKGIFARPCINKELLEKYHEGLIVTSGCLAGEVPQNIMLGKYEEAKKIAKWYKDLFGEDYYLEIQDHGFQEDRVVNTGIARIADKLNIKIVATNDSHFISCRDVEAHDALLCINTQKLIAEQKRMRYSGTEYLKSAEEMKLLFRDHLEDKVIEEAIANTLEVANKVKAYEGILGEPRIPDYPIPPEHNADTYLEELAWDGLLKRLKLKQKNELPLSYKERMETELKVLQEKGFSTYFLVVWDYIKHARDANIPVGPGRGSAAGSLVAYSLRITNIDPVHHGLLFERFLNPERKSMPDIDTDFCIESRDEMIDYVTERYGEERVAQIITFNRMTSKAVLKDVGRVLGVPFGEANKMAKFIPVARGKPAKLKVMISDETPSPDFKAAYENNEIQIEDNQAGKVSKVSVRQWIDMAIRIEGTNKTFGVHAAGVVISKERLDEIVPLQRNNDGSVITQYHMEDIESLGLLKMDFLGLKNLTIIQNTADLIEQNHHLLLVPDELPANERKAMEILARGNIKKMPEDVKKTYELIKSGDLEGIFQLESSGMVDVVKKLKPTCIEDISSILALYRPGPLDAGLIPKFIDRKHGREKIEYQHPKLEPILQETYGVLCLPKGTLIDKPDGSRVTIENVKSGELILSSDGRKVWQAKVARQWRSGVKEILKITLSSGAVIYAGKNHRFLTSEGDKFAWELKSGVRGVKNGLMYGSAVYEKWQVSSNQKQLRKNEAYLLGLLIGNASLVSSIPNISCSTEKGAVCVANLIDEIWGGEVKYYFDTLRGQIYLKLNSQSKVTPLAEFLDGIYGSRSWQVKSVDRHLPEDILDYSEKDRIDLLRGLSDSHGCDGERLFYFWSSSPRLLSQVGKLLGSLKIDYYLADNYVGVCDRSWFISILGNSQMPNKQQEEISENYLHISSLTLATGTNSSPRKTLEPSRQKSTLFRKPNFSNKSQLENWQKVRQSHLSISSLTLTTGLEDSILQTDSSSRKTLESSRQKSTLFRQTNFSDKFKLENWENWGKVRESHLQISPSTLTTGLEDLIPQTDSSSGKTLDSSQEKATLFRQTNFSNKSQLEHWQKVRENYLQISPSTLVTGLEDLIPQTDSSPRKTLEYSRQKSTLFRKTNLSDKSQLENWQKLRQSHLQISSFTLATDLEDLILQTNNSSRNLTIDLEDLIPQTDSYSRKTLESSQEKATLFRKTNFPETSQQKNWQKLRQSHLQISSSTLTNDLEDLIPQTDSSSGKTLDSSQEKATLFRQTNFSNKSQLENWQKVRENHLQISPSTLTNDLEDLIPQTDSSSQKTLESSRQKSTLFRKPNFSDKTKQENWGKVRETHLPISSLTLTNDLEDLIPQTDSSSGKTLKPSLEKATLFRKTNFSDKTKQENWGKVRESHLPISSLTLTTGLKDSIPQMDSSPRKTLESSQEKATLFRPTNFSDKTQLENWQKVRENHLQISPSTLATGLEDLIPQTDSSSRKTLESSLEKATLFRKTNFSDKTKQENWGKVRESHLPISSLTLTTGLKDSIPQTDSSSRKTQESSQEKATLFRKTNFPEKSQLENWQKVRETHLPISPSTLTTGLEDLIPQTDSSSRKTQESSQEKATLFRKTNFSDKTQQENWENWGKVRETHLPISPSTLTTGLEDLIPQTDSSSRKTQESSRQKSILFRKTNFSDKTQQENWENWGKVRESHLQISPLTLATDLEDSIPQMDNSSGKTLESSQKKSTLFRKTNPTEKSQWENWGKVRENHLPISPSTLTTDLEDSIPQMDNSSGKTLESSQEKSTLFRKTNPTEKSQWENWGKVRENHLPISPSTLTTDLE